jgi:diacylglycerol kinase
MAAFSFSARLKSFSHAFRGAGTLLRTQHNVWLHVLATLLVVAAGIFLKISRGDWALLVIAIALVWMAEAFNTAIEFLADEVTLEQRERIKYAKDAAAFGVLASAIAALVIGILVFLPRILPNG